MRIGVATYANQRVASQASRLIPIQRLKEFSLVLVLSLKIGVRGLPWWRHPAIEEAGRQEHGGGNLKRF